uniref:Sema domain-containing protein n=1 Tax=Acrobeloides nanus TaxID=290746 RepID=A0A914C695_9BILA
MKPQLRTLEGQNLMDLETPTTIIGICSPQDSLNTTAVYVEYGNPDDIPSIYSGIRTGLSLENHLIYRPPLVFNNKEIHSSLRTIYTDSKWLNEPHFVGSYSIDQYVYFFFRETAVESDGCGKMVYSRVARVCKNDLGGKNVLKQVWSSFVKARLNCSISSPFPYYFDHIQSVYKVDSETDSHFYATFTTTDGPFVASALCAFSLNHINQIFDNGVFLEQPTLSSLWVQTQPDQIPGTRPGTCVANTHSLTDAELHFAKSHLLMADAIPGGEPIIYRKDEIFTKMVADQKDDSTVVLFIQVANKQKLLKILHSRERSFFGQGRILAEYQLLDNEKIHAISILPNEYLFVADEKRVSQYRLGQCPLHNECVSCASDPYCSWNIARSECFAQETVHSTAVG